MEDEEEKIVKGDDVIVELDASLEDLYMGGSLKVRLHLSKYCSEFLNQIYISAVSGVCVMPLLNF